MVVGRAEERGRAALSAEAVQGAALALERVHDVHGRDGLPARVLGVGDRVADDVLEEDLEDAAGLLVDEAADALDAAAAGEAADGGLGDALDVVAEDLPEEGGGGESVRRGRGRGRRGRGEGKDSNRGGTDGETTYLAVALGAALAEALAALAASRHG